MSRVALERLDGMALNALEEVAAGAQDAPVKRTWALRLALAYLASRAVNRSELNRSSFNEFWWYLTSKEPVGRWQNLNRTLNGIYGALGLERDDRRTSHFEKQAKLARGRGSGADEAANHEIVSGDLFQ